MLDPVQQYKRILAGEDGVARIKIHPELRRLNSVYQIAENVHLLSEFRVLPVIVFVVIFDDELHAPRGGVGEASLNPLGREAKAVFERYVRPALPA